MWEIYVPSEYSDGSLIDTKFHKVWDAKVRSIAGGLTILVPTMGEWVDNSGNMFREQTIPVRIMCTREEIEEIINFTMIYYEQRAVLAYKISSDCIIRHRDEK